MNDDLRIKLLQVTKRLLIHYGKPQRQTDDDPLDALIATILSQNTSDVNSHRAFDSLKSRFPVWEQALAASTDDIADAIRCGGLAESKAPRIWRLLQQLKSQQSSLDLSFLKTMSTKDAYQYLLQVDGVGPKTAACVLLFSLGREIFPVDTHVQRIAVRLGLVEATASPERIQDLLTTYTPPGQCLNGHVLFIRLGREICRPTGPRCPECPLQELCSYAQNSYGNLM